MSKTKGWLLPLIGGALYTFGFPVYGTDYSVFFSPIIGITLLLLSLSWDATKSFKSQFSGELVKVLLFSLSYCMSGYYWIPYTMSEFGGIIFPFNYLIGALLSLIILPQMVVFIFLKYFILKKRFIEKSPYFSICCISILLVILEYFVPQQFPAHLGHPWLQLAPRIGLAPIFGAPMFSFVGYYLAMFFVLKLRFNKLDYTAPSVFSVFLLANLLMPLNLPDNPTEHITVKAIQPNVRNDLKVSAENGEQLSLNEVFDLLKATSIEQSETKADLIIWPETAYPIMLNRKLMKFSQHNIPSTIRDVITETNTDLVFGGYDKAAEYEPNYFETEYNSVFHISKELEVENVYHKMKLIPFGESLPFGPLNRIFSKILRNISFFAKGKEHTLFKLENGLPFSAAICYEILFSHFIRDYLNNLEETPQFIVNLTNDSWYGDTSEPHQHLFLSHWRAVEFGIPVVRVTNTGISSVLFEDGSESERLGVFVKGSKFFKIPVAKREATIFQSFGIWLTLIVTLCLALLILAAEKFLIRKS